MKPIRIKVVVQAKPENVPGWPHINYNYDKKTEEIMKGVRAYNPDAEFDVVRYTSVEQADAAYEADLKKYDGVLVLLMTNWIKIDQYYAQKAKDGLPCAIAAVEYCGSGSILITGAKITAEKLPVPFISSGDDTDTYRLARVLIASAKLKQTKILVVRNNIQVERQKKAEARFGVSFINKNSVDLMNLFDAVSDEEALPVVQKWSNNSLGILEPGNHDMLESAKLYLAICRMVKETGADAITIDCLNLSYQDELGANRHMYPCMSHFQMMEDGGLGVCEADIDSTISSLLVFYVSGRHGFVSDPVIDTSSNQIIYAHCVACRKVFDADDHRVCDYYIRSHAEDRRGVSVQVLFPEGEKLTTITF